MKPSYSHLGFYLKQVRKEKKLTQTKLAEGICSRSYISLLEQGQVTPSPEIVTQLAQKLKVDLQEFIVAASRKRRPCRCWSVRWKDSASKA